MGRIGIRVNAVAPGLTRTRMAEMTEIRAGESMISGSAVNRLAEPEETADVIKSLISDGASCALAMRKNILRMTYRSGSIGAHIGVRYPW